MWYFNKTCGIKLISTFILTIPLFLEAQKITQTQIRLYGTANLTNSGTNYFQTFDYGNLKTYAYPTMALNSSLLYYFNKNFFWENEIGYLVKGIKMYSYLYDVKNPVSKRIGLVLMSLQTGLGYRKTINQNNSFILTLGTGIDVRIGRSQINLYSIQVFNSIPEPFSVNYFFKYNKVVTPTFNLKIGINSLVSKMGRIETGLRLHFQTDPNYAACLSLLTLNDNNRIGFQSSIFRISMIGLYLGWVVNIKNKSMATLN